MKHNQRGDSSSARLATPVRPSGRRTQGERSSETRRILITAAIQLIHESGFAHLTIADVAHRAGLTTGAVQHHFPASRDLVRGVAETIYPMLRISGNEIYSSEQSLPDRVSHLVDVYWSVYRRPEYLVFWDLSFGTRDQIELRETLRSFQREVAVGMVAEIVRMFADIRMQQRSAAKLWTFVACQLRGLALLQMYEDLPTLNADLSLLKEATCHLLTVLTRPSKRA